MKIARLVALSLVAPALAVLALAASAAWAGVPPPPLLPPPELEKPIDGYDLRRPYELWRYWIEAQKGQAADELLAQPEEIDGERPIGAAPLRFTMCNDFGHYLTGEIRVYCRRQGEYGYDRAACHYVLRRAYVEPAVAGYGADPELEAWMRKTFDAPALARHFREIGLSPQTNWWSADRAAMFAGRPSAVPLLKAHATVVRLDSRDCPAMGKAFAALDKARLDLPLDIMAVGKDRKTTPPWPHSIITIYTLRVLSGTGGLTLESSDAVLADVVGPTLRAADACEQARRG